MKKVMFLLLAMVAMLSASAQTKMYIELFDGSILDLYTSEIKQVYWGEDDVKVTSITLDKTSLTLEIDDTYALVATVLPATAKNKDVTWTSSDPSVVSVSKTGKVMAMDYGTATITCTAKDGSGVKAECVVTVKRNDEPSVFDDNPKSFTVNGVSFTMIPVQAGTFQMGSTSGYYNEMPVHNVTISRDYYIGETEVTQALWKAVTGYSPTSSGDSWSSDYGIGDDYPAYYISWNDVQEFITKLNDLTGMEFRMPTEAEWEYAARGGNKSKEYTYSGSNTIGDVAWYIDNSDYKTHPVGSKAANELGIYDMTGNVWEWCSDWYGSSYYSSSPSTDPAGPTSGSNRVNRGGGWIYEASYCRSATRSYHTPSFRYYSLGVRLALSSSQTGTTPSTDPDVKMPYTHAVDLGLSVKWADMNVGAEKPEDYGWYFAWGETEPKEVYSWDTYKFGTEYNLTKYCTDGYYGQEDNKSVLDPEDDAAIVNWGGNWRMPTDEEWMELKSKCSWNDTTRNGVYGYRVIGPNGKSIFIPNAGYRDGSKHVSTVYHYWSNSNDTRSLNNAYFYTLPGGGGHLHLGSWIRTHGLSIRAVCP